MTALDRHRTPAGIKRAFLLYERVLKLQDRIIAERRDRFFGILANSDRLAVEYQQRVSWRLEVLRAFFLGREPNPYHKPWYKPPEAKA